ncbi:MAG: hypothetical protein ACKOEC_19685 [Acidimicrobiia bacterium]
MRLLLDECVPRPLEAELEAHDVHHVVDMGWAGRRNGELLRLMQAERFEVLLTVDKSLPFQQNLQAAAIAVVVMVAKTNRVKELRPLIPGVLVALAEIGPGQLIRVGG